MSEVEAIEKASAEVILADTKPGIAPAVRSVLEHFGGGAGLLRSSGDVYIKVNGVDTWFADPNVMYVKGSAEDPMVATERARAQRQYNLEKYTYDVLSPIAKQTLTEPVFSYTPQAPTPATTPGSAAPAGAATEPVYAGNTPVPRANAYKPYLPPRSTRRWTWRQPRRRV